MIKYLLVRTGSGSLENSNPYPVKKDPDPQDFLFAIFADPDPLQFWPDPDPKFLNSLKTIFLLLE